MRNTTVTVMESYMKRNEKFQRNIPDKLLIESIVRRKLNQAGKSVLLLSCYLNYILECNYNFHLPCEVFMQNFSQSFLEYVYPTEVCFLFKF